MAGLLDVLPVLVTVLQGCVLGGAPVASVTDHIPEMDPIGSDADLPAILLDVKAPIVGMASSGVRLVTWPIDIFAINGLRGGDIGASLPAIRSFPDEIIARLDAGTPFRGLLRRHVQFAEPAVAVENGDPFGLMGWKESTYVTTVVHALFEIQRQGGF
jgi:hypothetical protein